MRILGRVTSEAGSQREDGAIGGPENSYYLGIDLGTTFTAAAVQRGDGHAQMVDLGSHSPVVPSVLLLKENGELLCGDAAQRRATAEPHRVAREFKRRVGDPTPIILGQAPFAADALLAELLGWVANVASDREGTRPAGVAVTHPANWGEFKLDVLRQALRMADLDDAQLVSEPEAAAFHYAAQERITTGALVAVYDLGGGTFDTAVLRHGTSSWDVLGLPEGIERLGGIDVDEAIFRHVVITAGLSHLLDRTGAGATPAAEDEAAIHAAMHRLRQDCITAKETLSADTDTTIPVMVPSSATSPGGTCQVRLTRTEVESMIRPTLRATVDVLQRSLRSAAVEPEDVHSVLLVGGSSRIPLVAELVTVGLGRPIAIDAHPKHSVALGAARVAAEQRGGADRHAAALLDTQPASVTTADTEPVAALTGASAAPAFVAPISAGRASERDEPAGAVALAAPPDGPSSIRDRRPLAAFTASSAEGDEPVSAGEPKGSADDPAADAELEIHDDEGDHRPRRRRGVVLATILLVLLAAAGMLTLRPSGSEPSARSSGSSSAAVPAVGADVPGNRSSSPGTEESDDPHEHAGDGSEGEAGRLTGRDGDGGRSPGTDGGSGGSDAGGEGSSTSGGGGGGDAGGQSGQGGPVTTTAPTPESTTTTTVRRRRVPTVVGTEIKAAERELEDAGFVPAYDDACPADHHCKVATQDPAGGRRAPAGSRVHLTLETAPA